MSSSPTKPYRRFRARVRQNAAPEQEFAALRALNEQDAEPRRRSAPAEPKPRPARPAATRKRRWWSLRGVGAGGVVLRLGGLFLATFLIWALLGYLTLRGATAEANRHISPRAKAALADPGGGLLRTPQNTLVIGSDADRDRSGARADTVLIMRTDPDAGRVRYLSIPRDLRVNMPGIGHVKITEAFAYRGNRGVINAIRDELGIPIHHIMVIDFKGVSKMVDAVGGVTVDNPFDLQDCPYPGGRTVSFPRGKIDLDGPEALVYVRVRKCDSDLERAQRQQLVVAAIKSKLLSWSSLPVAPWRGARMVRAMGTDFSTTDLAKFGWLQGRLTTGPGDREVLAGSSQTIGNISYYLLDPEGAGPQIRRFAGK